MTYPTGNHVPAGYRPQMARAQLRPDQQGELVIQVANRRGVPARAATPVKVVNVANPVMLTADGHQIPGPGTREKPRTYVVGTLGKSAVTHEPMFRPELYKK